MFVSTYSTFVHANSSASNQTQTKAKTQQNFELKEQDYKRVPYLRSSQSFSTDYVAQNQNFFQKLLLEQKTDQNSKEILESTHKFKTTKEFQNAQNAYKEAEEKHASLFHYSHALDANNITNTQLSYEFQELQEQSKRKIMIRTYEANEKYYRLTA